MRAKLRVLEGSEESREIPLKGPKFFVGRDKTCHLRPRSDLISRHHCVILLDPDGLGIRDFGSKNGTLVNGQRVVDRQELLAGDVLTIGPLKFEVVIEQQVGAALTDDDSIHTDDDIDSWLQEPEEKVSPSPGDTHVMRKEDSAFTETTINKKSPAGAEPDSQDSSASERKRTQAHRSPAPLESGNAESQNAAARVLRELNKQMRDKRDGE